MVKDYTIGIYIRLSMADEDTGNGSKAESDSIGNQRMLINRYLDNHPTLSKYPRLEFADDGYTGTNFHRPQFAAMMEKVRHGEVNLICVKDFSPSTTGMTATITREQPAVLRSSCAASSMPHTARISQSKQQPPKSR